MAYGGWHHSLRDTNRHRRETDRERIQMGVKFYGKEELLSGLPDSHLPQDQEV
ncbi:hypothetical protein ACO0LD_20360 [Undibacterium sp. Ji83W]|uniref:hypothetical protein n=1 Tax=Undibacterium sp. Ji83W TaxID=3413043 RepID=UPI003BF13234